MTNSPPRDKPSAAGMQGGASSSGKPPSHAAGGKGFAAAAKRCFAQQQQRSYRGNTEAMDDDESDQQAAKEAPYTPGSMPTSGAAPGYDSAQEAPKEAPPRYGSADNNRPRAEDQQASGQGSAGRGGPVPSSSQYDAKPQIDDLLLSIQQQLAVALEAQHDQGVAAGAQQQQQQQHAGRLKAAVATHQAAAAAAKEDLGRLQAVHDELLPKLTAAECDAAATTRNMLTAAAAHKQQLQPLRAKVEAANLQLALLQQQVADLTPQAQHAERLLSDVRTLQQNILAVQGKLHSRDEHLSAQQEQLTVAQQQVASAQAEAAKEQQAVQRAAAAQQQAQDRAGFAQRAVFAAAGVDAVVMLLRLAAAKAAEGVQQRGCDELKSQLNASLGALAKAQQQLVRQQAAVEKLQHMADKLQAKG